MSFLFKISDNLFLVATVGVVIVFTFEALFSKKISKIIQLEIPKFLNNICFEIIKKLINNGKDVTKCNIIVLGFFLVLNE